MNSYYRSISKKKSNIKFIIDHSFSQELKAKMVSQASSPFLYQGLPCTDKVIVTLMNRWTHWQRYKTEYLERDQKRTVA